MSYPRIIKEAALEKMFHTDLSLRQISDELSIPRATLHCWKKQYSIAVVSSEWRIHLPNGLSVSFAGSVDARTLTTVLRTAAAVE